MTVPNNLKILCLNDDYGPLNIVSWKKGMRRIFEHPCEHCNGRGKTRKGEQCASCNGMGMLPPANVVEYYNIWIRDSKGRQHAIPAVIANIHHVKRPYLTVKFSKQNILRRDNYTCQYCETQLSPQELTMDHVVPRSMWKGNGTATCWQNIVTCCKTCNHKKANKTPEQAKMQLRKTLNGQVIYYKYPKKPNHQDLLLGLHGRSIQPEWEPYIAHILKNS